MSDLPHSLLPAVNASALREAVRCFPLLLDCARIGTARGVSLVECVPPHYYAAVLEEYRRTMLVRDRAATRALR